jgi:hypothetical protein
MRLIIIGVHIMLLILIWPNEEFGPMCDLGTVKSLGASQFALSVNDDSVQT